MKAYIKNKEELQRFYDLFFDKDSPGHLKIELPYSFPCMITHYIDQTDYAKFNIYHYIYQEDFEYMNKKDSSWATYELDNIEIPLLKDVCYFNEGYQIIYGK